MADLSDIENALLQVIQSAVYPSGTGQPSVVDVNVAVHRGWPNPSDLDTDLAAGKCRVSVFSQPNVTRNTTRYHRDEKLYSAPVHTVTATVSGGAITFGGAISVPQNVVVLVGRQEHFVYGVQAGDSLPSLAANVAALIAEKFPETSVTGETVNIVGAGALIVARVAGAGKVWTEQRRQEQGFQITVWCPTPALRDVLAPAVDVAFAQIDWITASDQSACRIRFSGERTSDEGEKVQIFRRDLFFIIEYPTTTITEAFEVGAVSVENDASGNTAAINY